MTLYQKVQQRLKDLETRLGSAILPVDKVNYMNALSRELFVYEVDRSIAYAREARKLAEEINYSQGIASSLNNEALCCRIRSDFKKSIQLSDKAQKIFESSGNKQGQADALSNVAFMEVNMEDYTSALTHAAKALLLSQEAGSKAVEAFSSLVNGMVYELLGDYPRAIEYHLKSLSLSHQAEDLSNEGASLINLGIVFRKIGEKDKARDHFEKADRLFEELQIPLLSASAKFNLGKIYTEFGDYPHALECLQRSLQIQKDIGHASGQGACYINIGAVFQKMRKFTEAEENIRQSIELARSFGKKNYECRGMLQLAECFLDQRQERDAIDILEEIHHEAERYGIKEVRYQILNALSRAYEMKRDFKKAFLFYKDAVVLREELINEESTEKNKGLMMLHEVDTARREREIALRDKVRAEQSEKFKEQFLTNMSHEIRTPMNAIAGLADLLAKTSMSSLQSKYVNAIHQSADNLLGIIQDILDFSKIEAGQMVLEVINFSIIECVEAVYNTLQYKAAEKSIALRCTCDQKIPSLVAGDPVPLKQILINLVGNAIKFTEKGSVNVHCSFEKEEDSFFWISFSVEDTGIGIPAEKLTDIFSSFVQATSSTARKYGGTGLGLSISKHLTEMQGGSIHVNSLEGSGTTFTFRIPYKNAIEEPKPFSGTDETPDLKNLRILLVEDNKFNQMVAVDSLVSVIPDVEIEVASNGLEALEKIHRQPFDVVLLDLQMPKMDGYETTDNIRRNNEPAIREIPIIALTANATNTEKEKCLKAGMDGYISKPFQSSQLLFQIQKVLEIKSHPVVMNK